MSKTPISELQEYMAGVQRTWGLPIYDLVNEHSGPLCPSFTYKVKCGPHSADGTARTKKDAKHKAAQEMLKILQPGVHRTSCSVESPRLSIYSQSPSTNSCIQLRSDSVSSNEIFVNSVGKLNEHCAQLKLSMPTYDVQNVYGPSHLPTFTMTCTIGKFKTKASASSKQQAKHDVAQNMLEILMKNPASHSAFSKSPKFLEYGKVLEESFKPTIDLLDAMIEQPKISLSASTSLAKELFPKLTLKDNVKVIKNVPVMEFHRALKESIEPEMRAIICKELRGISHLTKRELLKQIGKLMDMDVDYTTLASTEHGYAVSCTLDGVLVFRDIGIATTLYEAQEKAASKMLTTVNSLLT